MVGAANNTNGSIAAHETDKDSIQWYRNWPLPMNGVLAIPAAMSDVNPA